MSGGTGFTCLRIRWRKDRQTGEIRPQNTIDLIIDSIAAEQGAKAQLMIEIQENGT